MKLPDWKPCTLSMSDGRSVTVRHAWCVGRNYAEHAREMGSDPTREPPVFFSKPAAAVVQESAIAFPPRTGELHHEVELVLLLGSGGRDLSALAATDHVSAFAVGCDLTRRDVQARAKAAGAPWALAKGFDRSGPVGAFVAAEVWQPNAESAIELSVNGEVRQQAVLGEMIWSVGELLAQLSTEVTLRAGDVVFTGTPAGVGPLLPGDRIEARIEGLPPLEFSIVA